MMYRALYTIFVLCSLILCSTSCSDDELVSSTQVGEGESLVKATVSFRPFSEGLASSRTEGDAVKSIDDLCLLVYNEDGTEQLYYEFFSKTELDIKLVDRTHTSTDNKKDPAEAQTDNATFEFPLPYGKYQICTVANMGDISKNDKYKGSIGTVTDLKNIVLEWDANNVAENDEMFGSFTVKPTRESTPSVPTNFNTDVITINKREIYLHAWIKRAASKVTVAYDASQLNDNVYIYLKSVQIKDIPKTCYLGKDNEPPYGNGEAKPEEVLHNNAKNSIIYYKGAKSGDDGKTAYKNWPHVSRGKKYYYYTTSSENPESLDNAHTETMNALFFYENLQGTGKSKKQDDDNDNKLDWPGMPGDDTYKNKDDKLYGTYIEVKAYYVNENADITTSGDITYRFMLGKDELKDYNAERNYHYKLTLCFKGNANDVDWHIEYVEEPGVKLPDPGYISYLYNEEMVMPIRVVPENGQTVGSLKVEIISNPWWPNVTNNNIYYDTNLDKSLWNGFLSLGRLNQAIVDPANPTYRDSDVGTNEKVWKNYKLGTRIYSASNTGKQKYDPNPSNKVASSDLGGESTYEVSKLDNGEVSFKIPFYTLAKTMTSWTTYSGTNIYFTGERVASVRVTAYTGENGTGKVIGSARTIPVKQVKRLENPNGIWRKHDNVNPFTVKLYEQEGVIDGNSIEFHSHGPWRVYVESATNENGAKNASWIKLNGKAATGIGENHIMVQGETEDLIQFVYEPSGTIAENKVRCGVIVIEYNNYSCRHRIFVRQGYAPLQMVSGGVKWHSFNRYSFDKDTESPLDEGSMFKFGMRANAIDESNNWRYGFGFNERPTAKFKMVDGTEKSWSELGTDNGGFDDYEKDKVFVARTQDWQALRSGNMDYAFGVLYDDESESTPTSFVTATQYRRNSKSNKKRGMRGCFVYDKTTGKQLFFPIGATGYGRRKNGINIDYNGELKYAQFPDQYLEDNLRPMLWDLYLSKGAIYWCNKPVNVTTNGDGINFNTAWDINYRTFEFNLF